MAGIGCITLLMLVLSPVARSQLNAAAAAGSAAAPSGGLGMGPLGGGLGGVQPAAGLGGAVSPGLNNVLGGLQQQQPQQPQQPQDPAALKPQVMDLLCIDTPKAETWATVREVFRSLFAAPQGSPFIMASKEVVTKVSDVAVQVLKEANAIGPQAPDECGLGKLTLQLLSFVNIEDPAVLAQLFTQYEPIASPVLTVLLDVPWVNLAQSGWPVFGMLAQINLRKQELPGVMNSDEVDGLDIPIAQQFYASLGQLLQAPDKELLRAATNMYLQAGTGGSALGSLTAMAAQASRSDAQERIQIVETIQNGFRQIIGNGLELDVALSTAWPLFSLLQVVLDQVVGAA